MMSLLLLLLTAPALARGKAAAEDASSLSPQAHLVVGATRSTTLDLWRPYPDADKVLVPATLPDGTQELFLLDTGAATSVLTEEVAARLGLDPTVEAGYLSGLSGTVPWSRTMVPKLVLGGFELHGVEVAVGVPGVPDHLGALPIAGILGTNVWSNFVCVVDYPTDTLELYLAGEHRSRGRVAPLIVHDGGAATPVELTARGSDGDSITATVLLEVDTGAHDLLIAGAGGEPFRPVSTLGEEPVIGIGANLDEIPDRQILRPTRRLEVVELRAGGRRIRTELQASWLSGDGDDGRTPSLPGLLGYMAFKDYRVVLDFPGGVFQIARSRGAPRDFDALSAWLASDLARYGDDPTRAIDRATAQWAKNDRDGAFATLQAGIAARPGDPELVVTTAAALRMRGDVEGALRLLETLTPAQLAEENSWVTYVGSLVLAGRPADALTRAREALAAAADDHREELLVALSDALVANGRLQEASAAIDEANAASKRGGSAHLLRKARIAEAAGDRYGAMVALRELLEIIPLRGQPLWWYALLVEPSDLDTFRADVTRAMGRLHPTDQPYDFLGAAWATVGDATAARAALDAGLERDCVPLPAGADKANCEAWYLVLDGRDPSGAQAKIGAALEEEPDNSAYLDTAAVVALAAGDTASATAYARRAALLSPDDPYLLWQLSRIEATSRPAGGPPSPSR